MSRSYPLLSLVLVATAVLSWAPVAAGAPRPRSTYVLPNEDPFTARPGRALTIPRGGGTENPARLHVVAIDPRGRRRTLRDFDRYLVRRRRVFAGGGSDIERFEATVMQTRDRIVVDARRVLTFQEINDDYDVPSGSIILVGTPRGRVRELQTCRGDSEGGTAALDGERIAYRSCDGSRLIVRRLDRPRARPVSRRPNSLTVKLAGSYLAIWTAGPDRVSPNLDASIRVVRWPSLRPVFTLPGDRVSPFFELRRDGTLVAVRTSGPAPDVLPCVPDGEAVWLSPRDPRPHVLPATPCEDEVSLRGDQVLLGRLVSGRPNGGRSTVTDTALTDLQGTAPRRVLANAAPDFPARFAADGTVEVRRDGCGETLRVDFFALDDLLAGAPPRVRCRRRQPQTG